MAKKRKSLLGSLLSFVVALLVLATVAVVVVAQLSPNQVGVANKPIINGKSCADLGLANTKLKEFLPLVISFFNDNSALAKNAPTEKDGVDTDNCFVNSTVHQQQVNYYALTAVNAQFPSKHQFYLSDRQLCYVLNSAVSQLASVQSWESAPSVLDEVWNMENLQNMLHVVGKFNIQVCSLSFKTVDGNLQCQVVLSLDISNYLGQFDVLSGAIQNTVYVVLNYNAQVDGNGKLLLTDGVLSVNGQNSAISTLVLDALLLALSEQENAVTSEVLCSTFGNVFAQITNHVGQIGKYVDQTETLGMAGVDSQNHLVYFVAYSVN